MIVDCMTCLVRGRRCGDCAVTALRAHGPVPPLALVEPQISPELQLDAAEKRVVSMFVGAGLVSAGGVASLRARTESSPPPSWGTVRNVG